MLGLRVCTWLAYRIFSFFAGITVTLLAKILQSRQQVSMDRARGQTLAQGGLPSYILLVPVVFWSRDHSKG